MPSNGSNGTQQNATLTAPQEAAITALLTGSNISEAAGWAEVDRTTIHRWLREDFAFQAELNRRKHELRSGLQDRLMRLAGKATACVEAAVDAGDARMAMTLLKDLGILSPPEIGSEIADELRVAQAEQREQRFFRDVSLLSRPKDGGR